MRIRFAALAAMLFSAAQAQDYPAKPVHLVVPYVAGGNADIFGRTLAQKLGDAFRQPFIVENRAGANGGIGTDFVTKAAKSVSLTPFAPAPLSAIRSVVHTSSIHTISNKQRAPYPLQ